MCWRFIVPLILLAQTATADVQLLTRTHVPAKDEHFGGYSGFELEADGRTGLIASDRGWLFRVDMTRDADENIVDVSLERLLWPIPTGDLEGLALQPDGSFYLSSEGPPIVSWVDEFRMNCLPPHRSFTHLGLNQSLEAIALTKDGTVLVVSERPVGDSPVLPVYAMRHKQWQVDGYLPFDPAFWPSGADLGPDGRIYLLERAVSLLGFRSRIRRFDPDDPMGSVETLLTSRLNQFDNLEGLTIWVDDKGQTRITAISDNNFLSIQRSEIVEFILTE